MACKRARVKCEEQKPHCARCVRLSLGCLYQRPAVKKAAVRPEQRRLHRILPAAAVSASLSSLGTRIMISTSQVATMFDLYVSEPLNGLSAYDLEARGLLFASKSEPAVRYALAAMGILRASYTKHDDIIAIRSNESEALQCSVENYQQALVILADRLSTRTHAAAEAALHCCQVFMSIEALQADYAGAMRHFVQGLRIMREYRVRAYTDVTGRLVAAENPTLPRVDTFALKLFLAPCPGFRRPCGGTHLVQNEESALGQFRRGRTQIKGLVKALLDFLEGTLGTPQERLLTTRQQLLRQVEEWRRFMQPSLGKPLQIDEAAMFLCNQMLMVILVSTLDRTDEESTRLRLEMDKLQSVAIWLTTVRNCRTGRSRGLSTEELPSI